MTFKLVNTALKFRKWEMFLVLGLFSETGTALAQLESSSSAWKVSAAGHDRFYAVAYDKSGNSYAAGSIADSTDKAADSKTLIAKFNAEGKLDPTFGNSGYAIVNVISSADGEVARGVAVQSTGKIVIAGSVEATNSIDGRDRDLFALRLNADGSVDSTFGASGIATYDLSEGAVNGTSFVADGFGGLVLDAQDRLVIAASQKRAAALDTDFVLFRADANGQMDSSFGEEGRMTLDIRGLSASPKAPVLLPDGKILGTGYMRDGALVLPVVFKVDSNGNLDSSFGNAGVFSQAILDLVSEVYAVTLQGDSLVTVGYGRNNEQESLDFLSIRLTPNGMLDSTFGTNGFTRIDVDGNNDNGRNIAALPDGRLLLIGGGRFTSANLDGMLVLLSPDGTPDETFGENGTRLIDFGGSNDFLWGVAVSPQKDRVTTVGIKGVGSDLGNDDAAVVSILLK